MNDERISETLENILVKINELLEYIAVNSLPPDNDVKESAAIFALARTYDLLAQYDETAYQDGEYDES